VARLANNLAGVGLPSRRAHVPNVQGHVLLRWSRRLNVLLDLTKVYPSLCAPLGPRAESPPD
jgi:hypothetical protein